MRISFSIAFALVVGACGGAAPSSAPATSPSPSSTNVVGDAASASASATVAAACAANDLVVSQAGSDVGLGNRVVFFDVENDGKATCTLDGYPTVAFELASGAPMPTKIENANGSYFTPATPVQTVTIGPRERAHFEVSYFGTSATCPTSARMHVAFAGLAGNAVVATAIQACAGDTLHVSPIRAGRWTPP